MFSERLGQLAQEYVAAQRAQEQDPANDELKASVSEAHDRFVTRLEADGLHYFDEKDVTRIASGIMHGTFGVRYHICGRPVLLDGATVRIYGGKLAGRPIDKCPECGRRLSAFDLYADPGGPARDLLRQAGLYPTAEGLRLAATPAQRANILQELQEWLDSLGDGDLLAVYAVAIALLRDGSSDRI